MQQYTPLEIVTELGNLATEAGSNYSACNETVVSDMLSQSQNPDITSGNTLMKQIQIIREHLTDQQPTDLKVTVINRLLDDMVQSGLLIRV